MKRTIAALCLVAMIAVATAAVSVPAKSKTITIRGEIIDTGCYLGNGAHGEKHKECALKCAANGMPLSILTDKGKLILLTPNHDDLDPFNKAKEWAGSRVDATGTLMEKGGITALDLVSIKEAPAAPAK